jgi:exopolysaccharide biosynthesis WecB/TagA/CpsF family protein
MAHDLITADGFPIVLAGRLQGISVVRTAGSDLIGPIASLAAEIGAGVALIGSTEDSLGKAAAKLQAAHPGLQVTLQVSPPFGFDPMGAEAERLALNLRDSGVLLCFIALGAPKQEIFAARLRSLAPPSASFPSGPAGLHIGSSGQGASSVSEA